MRNATQLYQQSRSPLIQGKSRHDRPLWQAWLSAFALTVLAVIAWTATTPAGRAALASAKVTPYVLRELAVVALGAAVGVLLAKLWGWRRRWIGGVLAGSSAFVLFALGMLAYSRYIVR